MLFAVTNGISELAVPGPDVEKVWGESVLTRPKGRLGANFPDFCLPEKKTFFSGVGITKSACARRGEVSMTFPSRFFLCVGVLFPGLGFWRAAVYCRWQRKNLEC